MGTIGAAPPPAGRSARRPSSPTGWIVAGVLAAALIALVSYEFGSRRSVSHLSPSAIETPKAAKIESPLAPPPAVQSPEIPQAREGETGKEQSAVYEVTIPRAPSAASAPAHAQMGNAEPEPPAPAETRDEQIARCITLRVEEDEVHNAASPSITQVRAFAVNRCDTSFPLSDIAFVARAVRRHSGEVARYVGRFERDPIEQRSSTSIDPRGRAETVFFMECPACYGADFKYEIALRPSEPATGPRR